MYFITPLPVWGRRRYETAEPAGVEGKRGFVASYSLFSRRVSAVCPCVLPGLLILSPAWRPSPRAGYWGRRHGHGLRTSDPLCGWMLGRQKSAAWEETALLLQLPKASTVSPPCRRFPWVRRRSSGARRRSGGASLSQGAGQRRVNRFLQQRWRKW